MKEEKFTKNSGKNQNDRSFLSSNGFINYEEIQYCKDSELIEKRLLSALNDIISINQEEYSRGIVGSSTTRSKEKEFHEGNEYLFRAEKNIKMALKFLYGEKDDNYLEREGEEINLNGIFEDLLE